MDWTTGSLIVIAYVLGLISMWGWIKSNPSNFDKMKMLETIVEQACLFAERLIPGEGTGAEKRKFALQWIEAALEPYHIHFDPILVGTMIDALIEEWNEQKKAAISNVG